MKRIASTALLLLGLLGAPAVHAATPTEPAWDAPVGGLAGHGRHVGGGEWVWQDFVYDDGGRLAGAADVVEVRLRPHRKGLAMRVTLNTLRTQDRPVVGVALVTAAAAPARPWPHKAGVSSRWTDFLTLRQDTASYLTGSRTKRLRVTTDTQANTLSVVLPRALEGRLRLAVGSGAWDPAARSWSDAGVVDLAMNADGAEPRVDKDDFRSSQQSAAIRRGQVDAFATQVDLASLRRGVREVEPRGPGTWTRVYRSGVDLGEGYAPVFPTHRGRYQTSTVYVPPGGAAGAPRCLVLVLHSLSNIHNEYAATNVYPHLAGERGCLAVTPLAQGRDGWYWDEALVDTLAAVVDVQRHYPVDRERVSVTGYSMGGYGTYRLTTLLPELFSGAAVWAGVPAYYIWAYPAPPLSTPTRQEPGKTIDQLQNVGSIPFFIAHGTHDELVPPSGVTAMARRLDELGYEHRYELFAGIDHFSFTYIDDWHPWADWLGDRRRVKAPATVSFAARPASWVDRVRTPGERKALRASIDGLARELGAELDSAYWVRDVAVDGEADDDVTGKVELTSGGLPQRRVTSEPVREVNPGPPYVIGLTVQAPGPYGNVVTGRTRKVEAEPTSNTLTGKLTGVTALTVDLDRARLRLAGLQLDVTVDRPVTLRLRSGKKVRTVTLQPSS